MKVGDIITTAEFFVIDQDSFLGYHEYDGFHTDKIESLIPWVMCLPSPHGDWEGGSVGVGSTIGVLGFRDGQVILHLGTGPHVYTAEYLASTIKQARKGTIFLMPEKKVAEIIRRFEALSNV